MSAVIKIFVSCNSFFKLLNTLLCSFFSDCGHWHVPELPLKHLGVDFPVECPGKSGEIFIAWLGTESRHAGLPGICTKSLKCDNR